MKVFSIIAVRKGSKGLRGKCVRKIANKSVFEYVIEYSLKIDYELRGKHFTVVSSDSEIVRKHCSKNEIPFIKRSPLLASDTAQIEEVIYDAYLKAGREFDLISLLYGNIPTRYPEEFMKAYKFLKANKDIDAVLSMQKVEKYNPDWMFELNEEVLPTRKCAIYRRQDLKHYMIHDGHTILFRTDHFLRFMQEKGLSRKKGLYDSFGDKIKPMLNEKIIVDIDTQRDLQLAGAILSCRKRDGKHEIL
jgi:CMP-N-acetylneuraminic acid synthetase